MSMRRPSFTDFDRPYRRGIVLGLSLAELFIILIFLLLLAMIGYAASMEKELYELTKRVDEQGLAEKNAAAAEQASDVLRDKLAKVSQALEQAKKEKDEAQKRADKAEEDLAYRIEDDDPNALISQLTGKNKKLTEDNKGLRDKLATALPDAEIGKQVREKAGDLGVDPDELIASLQKEREGLEETLGQKGQDSPCWYRMAKRRNGEYYERALYIFDIEISDHYIFVKDIPAPTDEYKSQKEELPFDDTALNRRLDYEQFIPAFKSLKRAGSNRKVRNDRRCTFYVRVWDATGISNKSGYKRAHNEIVQNVFNTFEVKNELWPR